MILARAIEEILLDQVRRAAGELAPETLLLMYAKRADVVVRAEEITRRLMRYQARRTCYEQLSGRPCPIVLHECLRHLVP